MKSRTYPVTRRLWHAICVGSLALVSLMALVTASELTRVVLILRRVHPLASHAAAALLIGGAVYLVVRFLLARSRLRTLNAPVMPPPEKATFKDLKRVVQHHIARIKRAAAHRSLSPEQAKHFRQRAYDLEGMLGAHPLLDDLRRSISKNEAEVWQPLVEHLDRDAVEFARYKMTAVVRDAIEPPFPVVHPLLTFYHQGTLICCIVDCYVTRPSLMEYGMVIRDVWRVMAGGEYYRIGQRLFEGIYRNSPPMGRAAEDLGQALSVIWLTWTVAQAAMHRCRHLGAWSPELAMTHLDHLTIDSLLVTRDTLIRDVLPLIKLRLRHSLGPGTADAAGFSEQIMEGVVKAVDGVVQGLRAQAPEQAAEQSRRTLHGQPSHGLYQAPVDRRPRTPGKADA